MSIAAIYIKSTNQYTHHPPSKCSQGYLQMKSLNLGFGAIWQVLGRIVLSDQCELSSVSHTVLLHFRTTYLAGTDAA